MRFILLSQFSPLTLSVHRGQRTGFLKRIRIIARSLAVISVAQMRTVVTIIIIVVFGHGIQVYGQTPAHCALKYDSVLNRSYYTSMDKMPTYRGGPEALTKAINKNLKWPGPRCDIEGTVIVACIIESNGQLTNKRILKGLRNDEACNADKEALKVIDFLTSWTPGQCGGKNAAAQYIIPVRFKLTWD